MSSASLPAGLRLGPYEVVSPLGAGGMGEVYRARDTRLGRDVALKILPPAFAGDRDRLMRFEREARTLATLNHPHIAQILDVADSPSATGPQALVMELVEGSDLRVRILSGPVPLDEALPMARQIAEALEAAHAVGVIHRDLKPANIKVTPEGTVKVLDFGLAKALDPAGVSDDQSSVATITSPAETMRGLILGTAAYMAPEQAKGRPVDKRADIWAFGCVLYEMLTGVRAFQGEDTTDTIAAIVTRDPDWARLPAVTPPAIVRLLKRCLVKDRRNRLPDIAAARLEIDEASVEPRAEVAATVAPLRSSRARGLATTLAIAAAAAALGGLAGGWLAPKPAPPTAARPVRFAIAPADLDTSGLFPPELSPDGSQVAFVARPRTGGPTGLYLHDLGSGTTRRLDGSDGALSPFWSGDGRAVGYVANGRLLRTELSGGSPRAIIDVQEAFVGAAWNRDGDMVVSLRYGFFRIPAGGGAPVQITTLDRSRQENSHRWPQFLPDGQRFVFVARSGRPDRSAAYVGFLDGRTPVLLMESSSQVRYAPSGHLLYVDGQTLFARAFDASTLTLSGDPMRIADGQAQDGGLRSRFSVSGTGALAHQRLDLPRFALRWYDRAGRPMAVVGAPDRIANHRLSPDGSRVVIDVSDHPKGGRSVWLVDVATGSRSRVTFGESDDWLPIWSRDGERVLFGSYRDGPLDVYQRSASGATPATVVLASDVQKDPSDVSRDGATMLLSENTAERLGDVVAVTVATGARTVVAATGATEQRGRFSPDDRWVTYVSNESGQAQVYVQPFPPTGAKWQITSDGGTEPKWSGDGRELYYFSAGRGIMAVTVDATSGFRHGPPTLLVPLRVAAPGGGAQLFDVTPDGRRFLVRELAEVPDPATPIHVILNWPALFAAPGGRAPGD